MSARLPILTERLTLRVHRQEDGEALRAIYARPHVARFLLEDRWSVEDARAQVAKRIPRIGLDTSVRALALVIDLDGAVIGDVALWLVDDTDARAEIGWVLNPAAAGHGYATEAAAAVIRFGFAEHGLHRIEAQMDARNAASSRLCERLGMTQEAHLRQNWWSKGEWTDTLVYGILADDRQP